MLLPENELTKMQVPCTVHGAVQFFGVLMQTLFTHEYHIPHSSSVLQPSPTEVIVGLVIKVYADPVANPGVDLVTDLVTDPETDTVGVAGVAEVGSI